MTALRDRRSMLRAVALSGLAAALDGCGFQPVYMPTASGKPGPSQRELASVNIPVIPERPGQLLRQALQDHFGDDSGAPSAYDLQVSYQVTGEGIAVESATLATRIRLRGSAAWTLLTHDAQRKPLTAGSARAMDGVNIFGSQYFASDLETEVVYQRIAENIAQQITTQLAVWFRKRAALPPAG